MPSKELDRHVESNGDLNQSAASANCFAGLIFSYLLVTNADLVGCFLLC